MEETLNMNIYIYEYDKIINLKNNYIELPEDLLKIYNKNFEIISQSDNYKILKKNLKSMIIIRSTSNYSNIDKIKMKVTSNLNKLINSNIDEIKKYFLDNISNDELLIYFINEIYNKTICEKSFIDLYISIIIDFIKINNFYIDNNVNFYILIINQCQKKFEEILDKNYYNQIKINLKENINLYYKDKNKLIGNIKLIGSLYINDLLDFKIINDIIQHLMKEDEIKLELLYNLIKIIRNKLDVNYHNNLKTNYKKYVNKINNLRLEYFFDELYNNNNNNNNNKMLDITINNIMKLKNVINEFINHNKLDKTLEYLNEFINNYNDITYDYLNILFELDKDNIDKLINLYINIYKSNYIKFNNLINNIDKVYLELEDIIIDYPFAFDYFKNFILTLQKNNIINNIYSKKFLKF
tara:strand:+ start:1568 stop:2800 length:1233 start_codon:yes stop_codon:yes gene_type:complete